MTEGTPTAPSRRRFPYLLTVLAAAAFALLIALGVWQVRRLAWKTDLIRSIEQAERAPPRPLAEALLDVRNGKGGDFVRVAADCPGLNSAEWVELYALREGQAGVRLISASRKRRDPSSSVSSTSTGGTLRGLPSSSRPT